MKQAPFIFIWRTSLGKPYPVKVAEDMLGTFMRPDGNTGSAPKILFQRKLSPGEQHLDLDTLAQLYPCPGEST